MSSKHKKLSREVFIRAFGLLEEVQMELQKAAKSTLSKEEMDSFSKVILDLHDIFKNEPTLSSVSKQIFGEKFGEQIKEKGKSLDQAAIAYTENKPDALKKILGVMRNPAEFMVLGSQVLEAMNILRKTPYEPD